APNPWCKAARTMSARRSTSPTSTRTHCSPPSPLSSPSRSRWVKRPRSTWRTSPCRSRASICARRDVDDCEDQAWADYQAAVDGTHTKPGPWSDIPAAWDDYQDALANCRKQLNPDYRGRSDVQISADLVSGNSEGSLSVTGNVEVDLCRA